jgi:hypothetical protein
MPRGGVITAEAKRMPRGGVITAEAKRMLRGGRITAEAKLMPRGGLINGGAGGWFVAPLPPYRRRCGGSARALARAGCDRHDRG